MNKNYLLEKMLQVAIILKGYTYTQTGTMFRLVFDFAVSNLLMVTSNFEMSTATRKFNIRRKMVEQSQANIQALRINKN